MNNQDRKSQTYCIHGHEFTVENTTFTKSGYRQCRVCTNARHAEYRKRYPERQKGFPSQTREYQQAFHRAKLYKLSPEQYQKMYEEQLGMCAVCWLRPVNAVDHSHVTGTVRGLLCHQCNLALGLLMDDPHILQRAIGYLRRSEYVSITISDGEDDLGLCQ